MSGESTIIETMHGLGDSLYSRAVLHDFRAAYIRTPWPELFADLPHLTPIACESTLRIQDKHLKRRIRTWGAVPEADRIVPMILMYVDADFGQQLSIPHSLGRHTQAPQPLWKPPPLPNVRDIRALETVPWPVKLAVIRPVTERSEWRASARNPNPWYLYQAAKVLRKLGYFVVSLADLDPGREWMLDPAPPADLQLHRGELEVLELLALLQAAKCVVGGSGFIVPACMTVRTPLFLIGGGQGYYNHPESITDPSAQPWKFGYALPDRYCRCRHQDHGCDKAISDFLPKFRWWLHEAKL